MKTKKAVKSGKAAAKNTSSDLALNPKVQLADVSALEKASMSIWESFVNGITALTPDQYAPALEFIRRTEDMAKSAGKIIKPLITDIVKAKGKVETENGTMRANVGGYKLEIQPQSTKLNEKKVEALLRSKNLNPETHMDTVITYSVNQGKLDRLVAEGKMTEEELATCKPDEAWKVMAPKKED